MCVCHVPLRQDGLGGASWLDGVDVGGGDGLGSHRGLGLGSSGVVEAGGGIAALCTAGALSHLDCTDGDLTMSMAAVDALHHHHGHHSHHAELGLGADLGSGDGRVAGAGGSEAGRGGGQVAGGGGGGGSGPSGKVYTPAQRELLMEL